MGKRELEADEGGFKDEFDDGGRAALAASFVKPEDVGSDKIGAATGEG